jgi:hypothetical protein
MRQKEFIISLRLFDWKQAPNLAWLQHNLFAETITHQEKLAANVVQSAGLDDETRRAYLDAKQGTYAALRHAERTLAVDASDANRTRLTFVFQFDGDMAVSEDGRRLWLRQALESHVLNPVSQALMARILRATATSAPELPVLEALSSTWEAALADANQLHSEGLHIAGEA